MSSTKIKSMTMLLSSLIFSIILFLIIDFFCGHKLVISNKNLSLNEKPYQSFERGWYELKKNFVGRDQYGPHFFSVQTDEYGFRKDPNAPNIKEHNVIFLGDSFTYGINGPWDETFVGIFAASTGAKVLNAGVSSYSPTPYLYQYRKALKANILSDQHTVIIGIDISDVQDEAGYWVWDETTQTHPVKMASAPITDLTFRARMLEAFPLTTTLYRYFHYGPLANNDGRSELIDLPRSAFTWREWTDLDKTSPNEEPSGYAPLGVRGGLEKVAQRLSQIIRLAAESKSKVYLLIYPWPAQIVHLDKFNWSKWLVRLCAEENCAGVIDTTTDFRTLASQNKNWMSDYFFTGDIHFNKRGNQIIAEHLVNSVSLN